MRWLLSEQGRRATTAIGLALIIAVGIYLEMRHGGHPSSSNCQLVERSQGEDLAAYRRAVSSGYRNVRSRRVTLIALSSGSVLETGRNNRDPARIMNNVCEQRWYLARLIRHTATLGPAVIVLDKFFGVDSCGPGDEGTSDLIASVQESPVPVVVGLATHAPNAQTTDSCLIVTPSLAFGLRRGPNSEGSAKPAVDAGLTRLDSDVRKVPLGWSAYSSDEAFLAGDQPPTVGTMSWVAATLVDPQLKDEHRLEEMRANREHPFTSFIKPEQLVRVNALDVLCTSPAKDDVVLRYGVDCQSDPVDIRGIRGRVIVIGEDAPGKDRHSLFGQDVPGVYLQANYIESLLDGRYLRPFGAGWDLAILVVWLGFLYLAFWIQPELALLLSVGVGLAVKYGLTQLILSSGLYPQSGMQELGVLALGIKYVDSRGHLLMERFLQGGRENEQPLRNGEVAGDHVQAVKPPPPAGVEEGESGP